MPANLWISYDITTRKFQIHDYASLPHRGARSKVHENNIIMRY